MQSTPPSCRCMRAAGRRRGSSALSWPPAAGAAGRTPAGPAQYCRDPDARYRCVAKDRCWQLHMCAALARTLVCRSGDRRRWTHPEDIVAAHEAEARHCGLQSMIGSVTPAQEAQHTGPLDCRSTYLLRMRLCRPLPFDKLAETQHPGQAVLWAQRGKQHACRLLSACRMSPSAVKMMASRPSGTKATCDAGHHTLVHRV